MRLKKLLLWDIKLLGKNGFFFLYAALCFIYIFIILALPQKLRAGAGAILIYSDPAAMGLFFMGAILLLEKTQAIPCALAVSPVKVREYVLSKCVCLCVVSLLVAAVLAAAAGMARLPLVLFGTGLAAVAFTLLGIIIAAGISSLNQFIIQVVPWEILCFVPAIFHLFGISPKFLAIYPPNACMDMLTGKAPHPLGLILLIACIALLFHLACRRVDSMWRKGGLMKL